MDSYTETFAAPSLRSFPAVRLRVECAVGEATDLVEIEWGEHIPSVDSLIAIATALAQHNAVRLCPEGTSR